MSKNCVFCKISMKDIPSDIVYEDKNILAFKDLNPQSPTHILFIPRTHIESLNDVNENQKNVLGDILLRLKDLAKKYGIAEDGYRAVINCNAFGGQAVSHLHVHLLGGRRFSWPPG